MAAPSPARLTAHTTHIKRAEYYLGKAEALAQHPGTAEKGRAFAEIAHAYAVLAQTGVLLAIKQSLDGGTGAPAARPEASA